MLSFISIFSLELSVHSDGVPRRSSERSTARATTLFAMSEEEQGGLTTMTVHEETELRRVYDLLCGYAQSEPLKAKIASLEEGLSKLDPKVRPQSKPRFCLI